MTDVIYTVLFHFGYSLSFSFIKQRIKTVQFVDLDLTVISLQIVYVREWLCKTGFSKDILITFVIGLCTLCDLE